MSNGKIFVYSGICLALNALVLAQGCVVTGHASGQAAWGESSSSDSLEPMLEKPGPLEVETIAAARWQVPLEGMLNLEHPKARAAGLTSSNQPIEIYFHALRHPTRGLFLVDTGVEHALEADPERAAVRGFVAKLAKVDTIQVDVDLKTWLSGQEQPLAGVFF